MSEPNWTKQELRELWLRVGSEEAITDQERAALSEWIAEDAQARQQLVALSQQQAWLMWHGSLDSEADDDAMSRRVAAALAKIISEPNPAADLNPAAAALPFAPPVPGLIDWSSGWRFGITFSLGFLVAMIGVQGWLLSRQATEAPPIANLRAQSAPVGYLAMVNGCVWGSDGSRLHSLGSGVQQGDEISLQEGIAEFRLASGVFLSIEGPAALVLTSPSSLVLQHGKITTHVPWTVSDFKAVVGTCDITACDSEFGVSFLGRDIELHVFTGEAVTTSSELPAGDDTPLTTTAPSGYLTRCRVAQGRSLSLAQDADGMKVVSHDVADEVQFATRLPMAWPLPVTPSYVETVMKSKPVGYWRFESSAGGVVKSELPTGGNLSIIGDLRLSGDDDNRVAEFNQPGTGSRLISCEPTDILSHTDYSVEVWIKPSHLQCGGAVALLATPPDVPIESHAFYLELQGVRGRGMCSDTHPGCIRFVHRDPPGRNVAVGKSCLSDRRYRLRRWQHVVAVKEGPQMRLYLDGELVGTEHVETYLAKRLSLVVGQPQSDAPRDFWFVGQLDELALYEHALSEEEIAAHYKAIRWQPGRQVAANNPI